MRRWTVIWMFFYSSLMVVFGLVESFRGNPRYGLIMVALGVIVALLISDKPMED